MDKTHVLAVKTDPKWALIGLITIGLILTGLIVIFITSWISPKDQFVTLTFLDGEVMISDGFTDTAASTGPLATRNVRTLLKTGDGFAGLQMRDGSSVIVDSDSTIEFMQKNNNDPFQMFAFNLIKGRILVVSEKTGQTPTQMLLGGTEVVEVFQATVGLVATNSGTVRGRVDCLEGQCWVNGVYMLKTGQNAQILTGNIVQVTDGVLRDTWTLLSKASRTSLALSIHFERILSALTNTVIPTDRIVVANQGIPITGMNLASSTPGPTRTLWLTGTATLTQTNFFFRRVLPSPTSSGKIDLPPSATFTLVWTSTPSRTPTPTLVPSRTPTPSATIPPTFTSTPTQTYTATISPTPTLIPTATITPTPKPTNTPKPSPTPKPTHTPRFTPTNTPTIMPTNTPTIMPTDTPTNTVEPSPTATFIDTPVP